MNVNICLHGYNFDCFLKLSKVKVDTIQDEHKQKDFISAIRVDICDVMGDRYVNSNNRTMTKYDQRSIWYIDANNLYGYALKQKLPYKDFTFTDITLDELLSTDDDSDYDYWVICDLEYTNDFRDTTTIFQLLALRRKVDNNELGYK